MSADPSLPAPRRTPLRWRFLRALLNRQFATQLASLALDGYLHDVGWTRSARERTVVDAAGSPVPWATYPFIEFVGPRLRKELLVFEYGAGASTFYYATHAGRVVAVEHDAAFAADIRPRLPGNAQLWEQPLGEAYVRAVTRLDAAPDVVSVDGRERVACALAALEVLPPRGVLILDDSERVEYEPACVRLTDAGFRRLDFWGFSPGLASRRCTSVFYRDGNVLGL